MQKEYKIRHDCMGKVIDRELYKRLNFDNTTERSSTLPYTLV